MHDGGMKSLLERYNQLTESQKKRGLIAVLLMLGLVGVWLSGREEQQESVPLLPPEALAPISSTIHIHVVGEVAHPGLYELPTGSRASDAVQSAGGLTAEAAQQSINLARILSDGEQLTVLSIEAMAAGNSGGKVSLNRGTQADFESLSGIGPATSEKIIKYREANGGFSAIEELTQVPGIGSKLLASIRDQLTL
ncbi:MAG: competence protein ComEA [Candidatus Aquiluna sp. XM-24bin5]|nr:MAG: competence protein ComEA [Candidatus Aquiluna sp. XM-24bin5]